VDSLSLSLSWALPSPLRVRFPPPALLSQRVPSSHATAIGGSRVSQFLASTRRRLRRGCNTDATRTCVYACRNRHAPQLDSGAASFDVSFRAPSSIDFAGERYQISRRGSPLEAGLGSLSQLRLIRRYRTDRANLCEASAEKKASQCGKQ